MADEYDLEELIERPYRKRDEKYLPDTYDKFEEGYSSKRMMEEGYQDGSEEDEEEKMRKHKHKHKKSHKSKNHDKKKKKKRSHEVERYGEEIEGEDGYEEMMRGRKRHRRPVESEDSEYEVEMMHRYHRRRSPSESPPRRYESPPPPHYPKTQRTSPKRSSRRSEEQSREGMRSRSRNVKNRSRERSRDRYRRSGEGRSEERSPSKELTTEEKDARTVFCMQLSIRLRPIDLKEFFGKLGKIRDVRLIMDNRARRSKGIAYIEFQELDSVPKAMALNGHKLLGVPIIIQPSHGDRNRSNLPITTATGKPGNTGPMKLYVGSLHYNITEDMLRGLFEPFGPLDELKLMKDHISGKSAGYGFLQYRRYDDGKKALEQLNGYEIAGRPMKLGSVAEYQMAQGSSNLFDADEVDKVGFGMSATSRIQLMAKLAEGTGFEIPKAAANVLKQQGDELSKMAAPPIATQCFLLSNMFTNNETKDAEWEAELKEEVLEECGKHGGVLHLHIDKTSVQGHIYIKCPSIAAAMASVNTLHGRFFAGRQITAAYVPLPSYHNLFPHSIKAASLIQPSTAPEPSYPYYH